MSKRKDKPSRSLRAGDLPKAEDRRKRAVEADVVETVAGVMAGEVIAAAAGKGRKPKD